MPLKCFRYRVILFYSSAIMARSLPEFAQLIRDRNVGQLVLLLSGDSKMSTSGRADCWVLLIKWELWAYGRCSERTRSAGRLAWFDGWRPLGVRSVCIHHMNRVNWWQHYEHCHWYYYQLSENLCLIGLITGTVIVLRTWSVWSYDV